MSDPDKVDWEMLMRFGLGVLGLSPDEFWKMSPREFTAAAEGRLGNLARAKAMRRETFADLTREFPDHPAAKRGETT
ncbi:MAG: phage tail assembly chaperone [Pikeienuella sp.]